MNKKIESKVIQMTSAGDATRFLCENGEVWQYYNDKWSCILEAGYDKKEEKFPEEPVVDKVVCESCKSIVSPEFIQIGGGCDYCAPF